MGKGMVIVPLMAAAVFASATHAGPGDIRRAVVRAKASGVLHGSVVAGDAGRPVRASVGSISEPGGPDIEAETRFRIASVSKLLTQVAVLRLVEAGELDLDTPISAYRPSLDAPWKHDVTLRHLLAMTSGLPRELHGSPDHGVEYDGDGLAGPYLDRHAGVALAFEPGSDQAYSNLGYWIIGAAIESATGTPYVEAVNHLVMTPLAAGAVGLSPAELGADGFAAPHGSGAAGCDRAPDYPVDQRYSSGGLAASAGQVHAVAVGVFDGAFLSEESVSLLFSRFGTGDQEPTLMIAGMVPGFMNLVIIDREAEAAVVSLNNCVTPDPNEFLGAVRTIAGELGG